MKGFFRLDFGIYSRWSESMEFKDKPSIEFQEAIVDHLLSKNNLQELIENNEFTGFEFYLE